MDVRGKGEDRHHLRGDRDLPLRFARRSILAAAQPDDGPTDRAVADVDDTRPLDRLSLDAHRIPVVKAVVNECGRQVVRGANRVVVAGQVQVEVLHWDHLAVASSGSAALDPEHWPEGWLPDGYGGPPADSTESLGKPDGRRRLALAEWRRRDGRHDNVLAEWVLRLEPANRLQADLRLPRAVQLDLVIAKTELARDLDDRPRRHRARDLEIRRERLRARHRRIGFMGGPGGGRDAVCRQSGPGRRRPASGG